MPETLTAVQLCLLKDVLPLTVKFLGIADGNFPEGGTVAAGAPYTLEQVKKLIFQADYEIALLIVGNLEHPFRTQFVTEETDLLADGELVPPHVGQHSQVTLVNGEGDAAAVELGMPIDYSRIKRIKQNPVIYGAPKNLYAIFGGRIHFAVTATKGKLDIPIVTKDLTLAALLAPLPYFWAVVAGAIATAAMPGFPDAHRRYWRDLWMLYEREITGGAVAIPEPEQLERIGT